MVVSHGMWRERVCMGLEIMGCDDNLAREFPWQLVNLMITE